MANAAISIAGSILANLITQALEKARKLGAVKVELEVLGGSVSTLHDVLDNVEKQYYQSPQIKDWVEKLTDAFYDAQDVLEEFNIEAMQQELRGHNEMIKEVRTFFSCSNRLAFDVKMSRKLRAVSARIMAINAENEFHLDERTMYSREETHGFIHEEYIRGRDDDKKKVMNFLLHLDVKEDVSILPIVGIGGLGKTALAQCVYNDEMVSKQFDLKMWVCLSNDFDMKKIVKNIIACAKKEEPNDGALEQLQSELREEIDGKRYLLVLDDLWNLEQGKWLELKKLLAGGARGSKVLITTRLHLVAKIACTTLPHLLAGLTENASLDLLMQMACQKKEQMQDPNLLAIGKEIVKKCYGVPLVVRTVGSLLLFKKSEHEWSRFKDNELPDISQREDSILSVLRRSYDHLPSHLKQCFAFCSLFPKDYEINKQTLINLWMAQGFIQPSHTSQHLEDIAHGYFMDLLWRNFFQDFKEKPFMGEEICKMHNLMHDLACSVAGNRYLAAWDDTKSIHERTHHISYGLTFNLMGELPISRLKASALRTILSTTIYWEEREQIEQREPTSEANLHQLIQNFKRLRILDLHGIKVEKVPRSIYNLKHLTYLDLSYNHTLKRLPNSITGLQSLQTLNLDYCDALEELPSDIRKLVNLQNLYIDGCSKLSYLPRGLGELSSLHRLTRYILLKDKAQAKNYCRLGELKGLNNIRGRLSIENLRYVTNAEIECKNANLVEKHSLESLELTWRYFNTNDAVIANRDEALLDGLRPPLNLQELTIRYYKGETFPRWMMVDLLSFLPKLVKVWFWNCKRCKRLPSLGQLAHLKSLYIHDMPELECLESDQSSSSIASFPSLLKLEIDGCEKLKAMPLAPHLEELNLACAHGELINQMMPGLNKLKRLDIWCRKFLEFLPEKCFQSLTSLESLRINNCHQLTSLSQGMRHLTSLEDLSIGQCAELDISKDESGNILDFHGLHSLRSMEIFHLPKLASLPQWLLQASNLERLHISRCRNLKDVPEQIKALRSLQQLEIYCCDSLTSLSEGMRGLTSLTHLRIVYCRNLKALPEQIEALRSLQRLIIMESPLLTSLPKGMRRLTSLTHLALNYCNELDISKDESGNILDFHGGLPSLRSVDISGLTKLTFLPQWLLQARNLERLKIWECCNLKDIPEQIEALQSLQYLNISHCSSLTSFPEAMRWLTSLTHLQIHKCRELEESCNKEAGKDWDKIAHIPNINIGR